MTVKQRVEKNLKIFKVTTKKGEGAQVVTKTSKMDNATGRVRVTVQFAVDEYDRIVDEIEKGSPWIGKVTDKIVSLYIHSKAIK